MSSYALQLNALIPGVYPQYIQYQNVLPRILNGDPTEFDYIGDGDFPPADFSYAFPPFQPQSISYPFSPLVAYFADLFPQGGQINFTTQLVADNLPAMATLGINDTSNAVATPEPTTLAGLGLAGLGLAIAHRRKQKATTYD